MITFHKGDTYNLGVKLKGYAGVIDKMYLTVKDKSEKVVIQKRLNEGIELYDTVEENGVQSKVYKVSFLCEDTDNLKVGNVVYKQSEYDYDIEIIINEPYFKRTLDKGQFILQPEVTCCTDEK